MLRLPSQQQVSFSTQLAPPRVLYSNNHVLAVHKPAGWHSIPAKGSNKKCLLTWLQRHKLGGGSQKNFLNPLHRLDQPCTGVLLLAKTSKAASRITTVWKRHEVKKTYACILSSSTNRLIQASGTKDKDGWYTLQGLLSRKKKESVTTIATATNASTRQQGRLCTIQWKLLEGSNMNKQLIAVKTSEGARHMVRALLAHVGGSPIAGDLRYGASHPLPDRSVALHAWKVNLPQTLVLPLDQHEFVSPFPTAWNSWF